MVRQTGIRVKKGGVNRRPSFTCLLLTLMLLHAVPALAQEPATSPPATKFAERSDDELVLVGIRVGRTLVAESIPGYFDRTTLYLPLGQLSDVLQFPIRTAPLQGQADGWFLSSENKFSLDLPHREVIIAGNRTQFAQGRVEAHQDDIYVDSKLLEEWFPVTFAFSFAAQTVTIEAKPGTQLPIQIAAEREKARAQLSRYAEPDTKLPRAYVPYKFFRIPFTDVTYSGGYDTLYHDGVYNEATALASGDLFYMHSRIYASVDQEDKFNDLRWTLSRRDPDGKIFQPGEKLKGTALGNAFERAQVREIAFGDINSQQMPLTANNQQGRGFLISNIPYDRATQYDRTTIQGDLQPGWDVELYRNDELLFFQQASSNGRYEFPDVPLLSGLNIIRLVFYGPFGEKREELQRFRVSPDLTKKGQSYFRFSASQQDTSIFDIQQRNRRAFNVVGVTPLQSDVVQGKARNLFEYEYGLTDRVALFASAANFTTPDAVTRNYGSAGVATTVAGTYLRGDVAHDAKEGGNAVEFTAQDNIKGVSVSATTQHFRDFISDYTENVTDPLTDRSTVRADTPMNLGSFRFNTGVAGSRSRYVSDRLVHEASLRLSTSVERLSLSHNLSYRTDNSPGLTTLVLSPVTGLPIVTTSFDKETFGELIASFPFRNVILRGDMRYGISPNTDVQYLSASSEYNFTRNTNAIFQIDRQMLQPSLTTFTLGVNHRFEKFLLGARTSYASDGDVSVGATMSLTFGPNPRTGNLEFYPDYAARDGLISVHSYHDMNDNGRVDRADRSLENSRFLVNRGSSENSTNKRGNALIRNIPPDTHVRFTLDDKSIETPYLGAAIPGVDVVTRPGVAAVIDYPLIASGDVEGTVYVVDDAGNRKEAANVELQVISPQGAVLRTTRTSYDGYYLFNAVSAGKYALRVAPEQAERLGFKVEESREFAIQNIEENSQVIDLTIHRSKPLQVTSAETPAP